jgi:hypothetical protein
LETDNGQWSIVNGQFSPTSHHSSLTKHIHPFYFTDFFWICIFVPDMALLDLDKIIIKRTVLGIRCTSCGGNLAIAKKRSVTDFFIKLISFGMIKPKTYECENCKKKYLLV